MTNYEPILESTRIDTGEFAVIAQDKEERDCRYEKMRGTWSACDDYAERNNSEDNYERYTVAKIKEARCRV